MMLGRRASAGTGQHGEAGHQKKNPCQLQVLRTSCHGGSHPHVPPPDLHAQQGRLSPPQHPSGCDPVLTKGRRHPLSSPRDTEALGGHHPSHSCLLISVVGGAWWARSRCFGHWGTQGHWAWGKAGEALGKQSPPGLLSPPDTGRPPGSLQTNVPKVSRPECTNTVLGDVSLLTGLGVAWPHCPCIPRVMGRVRGCGVRAACRSRGDSNTDRGQGNGLQKINEDK